jgi:hypothetical protein
MRPLLFFLLAVATVSAVEGVRGDETAVKGLSFFRHFGQTHRNRREWNLELECDYDHVDKSAHCPPVHHIQPFPPQQVDMEVQVQEPQQVLGEP